jgi:micrococcal nuclease
MLKSLPVPLRPSARLQRLLALLACLLSLGAAAETHSVEATVTRVTDGDSVWLAPVPAGAPVELRLQDIDAPEICQAWGVQARQALADLVLHKSVSVRVSGHDSYGRTLGTLFLDTLNVNKTMVQEGHAWSSRYRFDRGPYVADERMAKALSRGLNREAGAVMPKDFRRDHGPCQPGETPSSQTAALVPAAAGTSEPKALASAAAPALAAYRCDGRTYCSQMHSCAEATFFLKNCPGVKMDGNHDGVPCERQWCR